MPRQNNVSYQPPTHCFVCGNLKRFNVIAEQQITLRDGKPVSVCREHAHQISGAVDPFDAIRRIKGENT